MRPLARLPLCRRGTQPGASIHAGPLRMRDLLVELMNTAARHADYADARFVRIRNERLSTRNGAPDQLMLEEARASAYAFGWAGPGGSPQRAAASGATPRRHSHGPWPWHVPSRGSTPLRLPGSHRSEAFGRVRWSATRLRSRSRTSCRCWRRRPRAPGPAEAVKLAIARFEAWETEKLFASSEGALCEQRITECGGGIAAEAARRRSQPDPLLSGLPWEPRGPGRLRALSRARPPEAALHGWPRRR